MKTDLSLNMPETGVAALEPIMQRLIDGGFGNFEVTVLSMIVGHLVASIGADAAVETICELVAALRLQRGELHVDGERVEPPGKG